MEITLAQHSDLPGMITLLKASLGEQLIPKSEELFLWKHEKNPFGKSKTYLAKENGNIIGLRTFMPWRWVGNNETIKAVRAVDTATDPAFQGKGIFKKLTLHAVEASKAEGIDMIFNTPNPVSMAGYLKMGWEIAGRMPIYIGPGNLFPKKWNADNEEEIRHLYPIMHFEINSSTAGLFHTPITAEYIKWRYFDCPVVKYAAVIENEFGFIFRLKKIKNYSELRICEIWCKPQFSAQKYLKASLKTCMSKLKPIIITCAPSPLLMQKPLFTLFGPFKKGPVTTIRPVLMPDLENFKDFKKWQPSIGSLELF